MNLVTGGVPWFPQEYAETFYITKGLVALVAVVLLLIHMQAVWGDHMTWGRRLRYLAPLYFAVLLTSATVEQVHETAPVNYRNLGGLLGALLLIATALVSMREQRRR